MEDALPLFIDVLIHHRRRCRPLPAELPAARPGGVFSTKLCVINSSPARSLVAARSLGFRLFARGGASWAGRDAHPGPAIIHHNLLLLPSSRRSPHGGSSVQDAVIGPHGLDPVSLSRMRGGAFPQSYRRDDPGFLARFPGIDRANSWPPACQGAPGIGGIFTGLWKRDGKPPASPYPQVWRSRASTTAPALAPVGEGVARPPYSTRTQRVPCDAASDYATARHCMGAWPPPRQRLRPLTAPCCSRC
jgi:hypothetical protein